MSQATLEPKESRTPAPSEAPEYPQRGRRGRIAVIAVLVVALLASAAARELAQAVRVGAVPAGQAAGGGAGQGITGMNSFALALLLGGLRGPLVMMLWSSSETQKADRQLEDFDTRVEWIRLLQPEFDSVHLYQIWNKAYNISVQMASLSNKYATILDAIDYARDVDDERPNNINIIQQLGSVYFDKLANSHGESHYYIRRMREETLTRPGRPQALQRTDPGWRRVEHDPMLDEHGYILEQYRRTNPRRQVGSPESGEEFNDGSELQYLLPYEPFPHGLSPFAVGFNYYKQAQVLQSVGHQRHAQLSPMVLDSRPAVTMMFWSEDELRRGRRMELRAFGMPAPLELLDLEMPGAGIGLDETIIDTEALEAAIEAYDMARRIAVDARPEYERHLRLYDRNVMNYMRHLDNLSTTEALASADRDYLRAMLAEGSDREALLAEARRNYELAVENATYIILRYYVDVQDEQMMALFPPGVGRYDLRDLPQSQRLELLRAVLALSATYEYDFYAEGRELYELHVERALQRLEQIPS